MATDDWRLRIELPDEEGARGLLERLGLARSDADDLAAELRNERLAVSQDGDTVFVYAASGMLAEQASRIVERELQDAGVTPTRLVTEHWLSEEERWDDDAPQGTWEQEEIVARAREAGIRVHDLAEQLRAEGYGVSRTFTYVIAGTASRDQAVALARRVHGKVEPGGELVYEVQPQNPFAVFGGLGT